MSRPKIYLAGPTVFHAQNFKLGDDLKTLCADNGLEGLYPLDGPPLSDPRAIRDANVAMIRKADAILADLTPFRGPHADDGTAFEVGFASALGKPIFAYADNLGLMIDRIPVSSTAGSRKFDKDMWEIENFGQRHNLMLTGSIECLEDTAERAVAIAVQWLLPKHS